MKLLDLLSPQAVKVISGATSKKRLMNDVAELAGTAYDIDVQDALQALLERESLGPTGVGQGVALPHARVEGLPNVVGVFMVLERAVDFDAVDRQPVDLVFGLFAPEEAGVEHLKALALISRTLREPSICTKLRANPDPSTLYAILTEAEAVQAA